MDFFFFLSLRVLIIYIFFTWQCLKACYPLRRFTVGLKSVEMWFTDFTERQKTGAKVEQMTSYLVMTQTSYPITDVLIYLLIEDRL